MLTCAPIIYVLKTFTGDYLQVVHGYKHVDGDGPFKNCIKPEYTEMTKNMVRGRHHKDVPKEEWAPYYEEIANQTINAANDDEKVVLTYATCQQRARDVVIKTLVQGGISRDHITIVQLTIDEDVKLRGLYKRFKRLAEQNGITLEELRPDLLEYIEEDVLTEESFIKAMSAFQKSTASAFEACPMAEKVDVSGRDITHCDNLDEALGLTRSSDWTYESILEKVLPLDVARDEEFAANGSTDLLIEIWNDIISDPTIKDNVKDSKEVKEMKKKRRSTLVERSW